MMALSKPNEVPFANLSVVEFNKELDSRFRCPICKNPLSDPVQTECGHRLCYGCLQKILRRSNPQCPVDKEPLSSRIFRDVCCRREIASLLCYCVFKKHGCKWKKELMYLEDHMQACEYQEIKCSYNGCNEILPKNKLQHHIIETCKYKPSRCQSCGQSIPEVDTADTEPVSLWLKTDI